MKKCKNCGELKDIIYFPIHKQMKDGHTNKCTVCTNEYAKNNYREKSKDPNFLERERIRSREKNKRLKTMIQSSKEYRIKFPEKHKAHSSSQYLKKSDSKNHNHHWNYNDDYHKDVIELTPKDHKILHSYMIYDQERMMYRGLDGVLLDSKQSHLDLLKKIKNIL